jgi:hypothetical protein
MKTKVCLAPLAAWLVVAQVEVAWGEPGAPATNKVRVAAAQTVSRVIDFRLKPDAALAAVEKNLAELERVVDRAGEVFSRARRMRRLPPSSACAKSIPIPGLIARRRNDSPNFSRRPLNRHGAGSEDEQILG